MRFCLLLLALTQSSCTPVSAYDSFVIGHSVQGKEIEAFRFGQGANCLVVAGGIHGAFEANTIQITDALIEELKESEDSLPLVVYVIKNLNPDGFRSTWKNPVARRDAGILRMNAHSVDLNRNWDTPDWKRHVTYTRNETREWAGGPTPMSEPEVQSFASFVLGLQDMYGICPVIMLHSFVFQDVEIGAAFPSYHSDDKGRRHTDAFAMEMVRSFSSTGEFTSHSEWDQYEVPGEFLHWAGIHGIPAIDVELGGLRNVFLAREKGHPSHWDSFSAGFHAVISRLFRK